MLNRVIFLGIDGVLVPDNEGVPSCHQFLPRCAEARRSVLAAVPRARIVFATTWRPPLHINRLHEQWTAHGFPEGLAIDGTTDLREETSVPRMYRRGHEIRAWLKAHPEVTRWVVVDDGRLAIEPIHGISMAASAGAFPLTSIRAGTRERNPEGEEFGVVDMEDCLSFLIQVTNVW